MMNRNDVRSMGGFAAAIGGKGLLFALVLAGAGMQGCGTEESPAGPAGSEPAMDNGVAEDETGADIVAPVPAQGNAQDPEVAIAARAAGTPAPSCVILEQWKTPWRSGGYAFARATNTCRTSVRLRFIWRYASDGPCVTLPSGYHVTERAGRPAYVTELRGC